MTKEELEKYKPKGELEGFPKEIIARMLQCQEEQGNEKDVTVFERYITLKHRRFEWLYTKEGYDFWNKVIRHKNFDLFFEKYPKQDKSINIVRVENKENNSTPNFTYAENSCDIVIDTEDAQKFKVEDKVYDIILGEVGIVKEITTNDILIFGIKVVFENYGIAFYTPEGKSLSIDKYPRLFHYRDDYNYDIIDFNNLPKRQKPKRWRAEKEGDYYAITAPAFQIGHYFDEYIDSDNEDFEIGNYFQTKEQAQEVADKLKEYFKQLIQKEHE